VHCYEAVDIDDFVRVCWRFVIVLNDTYRLQLSNEFQFPVAAFHHASEAYLVPDVLKRAYGSLHQLLLTFPRAKAKSQVKHLGSRCLPQLVGINERPTDPQSLHLVYYTNMAFTSR
jgi:hypothetical protein